LESSEMAHRPETYSPNVVEVEFSKSRIQDPAYEET
jgi:hypothetical protein